MSRAPRKPSPVPNLRRPGRIQRIAICALCIVFRLVTPAVAERPDWRELSIVGIQVGDNSSTFSRRLSHPRTQTSLGLREWSFSKERLRVGLNMESAVVLLVGHQLEYRGQTFQAPSEAWQGESGSPITTLKKTLGEPDNFTALGPEGCLYYAFMTYEWPEVRLLIGLTHPDSGREMRATSFRLEKRDPLDAWTSPYSPNGRFWLRAISQRDETSDTWPVVPSLVRHSDGQEVWQATVPWETRSYAWAGSEELELELNTPTDGYATKLWIALGAGTFKTGSNAVHPITFLNSHLGSKLAPTSTTNTPP